MKKKNNLKSFSRLRDTFLGTPFLFALNGFAKPRRAVFPRQINSIGFLKLMSVADTMAIEPFINAVKLKFPNSFLTFFASKDNAEIACKLNGVDNVIVLDLDDVKGSMKQVRTQGGFDAWVDFGKWSKFEAIMTYAAMARYKLGFVCEGENRHFSFDKTIWYTNIHSTYENFKNLLALIRIETSAPPKLERLGDIDEKLVVINMFSDNDLQTSRLWVSENWHHLVTHLAADGYRVALTGSKDDIAGAEQFIDSIDNKLDVDYLVGRQTLDETISTLSKAALVISVDSGILHIAASLGVDTIGLFGATTKLSAPVSSSLIVIEAKVSCKGCQDIYDRQACRNNEPICMQRITVAEVEESVLKILKRVK